MASWVHPNIIVAAVSLAAAALGFAGWAWWRLPKWQLTHLPGLADDDKAKADVEYNFRKTIGQLIGGAVVLIGAAVGATFTYLQFSQQLQASHELFISTQVSKGFEQLGSKKPVIQLGGIYALEGVMKTSEQYHQPVLETLCAFVRDRTKTETGNGPPATEIQAALTVIGRRTPLETVLPNLAYAHIPRANLRNADLRGAVLYNADLRGADLRGADLRGAFLLYPTQPPKAVADLEGANLWGADLRGAVVNQAQLDQACGSDVTLDPGLTIKPC
jgi:hypothetical protein